METIRVAQPSYLSEFQRDGVFVFKNMIDRSFIPIMTDEINKVREIVMQQIETMPRPLRTYSDIAERHLGRLDYRCGFNAEIFHTVGEPIIKLVQSLSPQIDFRHYWGAIPSLPGSGPTNMHRDVYPILNTTEGVNLDCIDINLPPYYFTVLIPLVQLTPRNGPTIFLKGSHQRMVVDETKEQIFAPLLCPGEVCIFDGRLLHKGAANESREERLVAYMTFVANWYHDQTFEINDYLFPELSVRGK